MRMTSIGSHVGMLSSQLVELWEGLGGVVLSGSVRLGMGFEASEAHTRPSHFLSFFL